MPKSGQGRHSLSIVYDTQYCKLAQSQLLMGFCIYHIII
nr:MAG TPA: hypothetical protein [Bacteriophage sp.]